MYLPGKLFTTVPAKVGVDKPLPVVLYMHGCTGIEPRHDEKWAEYIKGLGFIVVLPDSMARPRRRWNCDPRSKTGGAFPRAYEMRQEEIRYAVAKFLKENLLP